MFLRICLDDETSRRLRALARKEGASRNSLIRAAISTLLDKSGYPKWFASILKHKGFPEFPDMAGDNEVLLLPPRDNFFD